MREKGGGGERQRNPRDTGRPTDPVEDLTKDRRAYQAAGKVTGEIDTTGSATVCGCSLADEAGRRRLCQERPNSDEDHAQQDHREIRQQKKRQADTSQGQ